MFHAEVIMSIPGQTILQNANRLFSSNGAEYRGLVLLEYVSSQPSPANLTWSVISEGREDAWNQLTRVLDAQHEAPFSSYRELSNDAIRQDWPDLLHGRELSETRNILCAYTKNPWRTIWISKAAEDALNSRHEETFAIAIQLTSNKSAKVRLPKDTSYKDNDDKSGSGAGRSGTIRKMVTKVKSSMSLRSFAGKKT